MKATAVGGVTAAASVPVVWDFLGYRFEAGPLVVAVCATLMTRIIVALNTGTKQRVALDIVVTALSVLISALWVQANSLALLQAGLSGIGFGALGIGIISIAKGPIAIAFKAAFQTFLGTFGKADPYRKDPDGDLLHEIDRQDDEQARRDRG